MTKSGSSVPPVLLLLLQLCASSNTIHFDKAVYFERVQMKVDHNLAVMQAAANATVEEAAESLRIERAARAFRLRRAPRRRDVIEFTSAAEFRGASRHLYYDKVHKFVVCGVPKAACTELMKLVYRLRGDAEWFTDPHFRTDAPSFARLTRVRATAIMNDPTWTKVAFLRDPLSRLLSAWLDKFVQSPKRGFSANYGIKLFGREMTFAEFVHQVVSNNTDRELPEGLHLGTNPHWKSQSMLCSLEKFLPVYSFVGRYEHLQEHSESLLRSLGLWEEFGKSGWAPRWMGFRLDGKKTPPPNALRDKLFAANGATHRTSAEALREKYYTPRIIKRVRVAYAADYALFNATGAHADGRPPATGGGWQVKERSLCRITQKHSPGHFGQYCGE